MRTQFLQNASTYQEFEKYKCNQDKDFINVNTQ